MSIFKNETLAKIDAMVPPQMGKVTQVLLFTLIDEFINSGCKNEDEFIGNLKSFLGVKR
jgi:hypothetical protein